MNKILQRFNIYGFIVLCQLTLLLGFMPSHVQAQAEQPGIVYKKAEGHPYRVVYVVRRGDTLTMIAARYDVSVREIMDANYIHNPHRIYVGQHLSIPTMTEDTGCQHTYIVRRRDTLSQIALRYGLETQHLSRANNLRNQNHIYVGQHLCIPSKPMKTKYHHRPAYDSHQDIYSDSISAEHHYPKQRDPKHGSSYRGQNSMMNDNTMEDTGYNPHSMPGYDSKHPPHTEMQHGNSGYESHVEYYYTVRRGDDLRSIARMHGTTVEELLRLNHIRNPNILHVGQTIRIQ